MTKLEKPLRREIAIGEQPFVVTLSPEGFKLVGKGRRKGLEIKWQELVSGEAALATALQASITGDVPLAPSKGNAVERKPATKRSRQSRAGRRSQP